MVKRMFPEAKECNINPIVTPKKHSYGVRYIRTEEWGVHTKYGFYIVNNDTIRKVK